MVVHALALPSLVAILLIKFVFAWNEGLCSEREERRVMVVVGQKKILS